MIKRAFGGAACLTTDDRRPTTDALCRRAIARPYAARPPSSVLRRNLAARPRHQQCQQRRARHNARRVDVLARAMILATHRAEAIQHGQPRAS